MWTSSTGYRLDTAVTAILTTIVDDEYTQIQFRRQRNDVNVTVAYQVITGDEFTVQVGETRLSTSSTAIDVTISEVDLSQTFVITTARSYESSTNPNDSVFFIRAELTNATTLHLERDTDGHDVDTVWHAVTMEGATVQQFTGNISSGTTADVSIASVDLSKTFLVHTFECNRFYYGAGDSIQARFLNSSTVALKCTTSLSAVVKGFVVTHPKISVTSGLTAMISGVDTAQETISIQNDAFTITNTISGTSAMTNVFVTHILDSPYVNFKRDYSSGDCEIAWFAVEWRPVIAPANLAPDDVAIMPGEGNTFRWAKDSSMTATAYEWGYREVGAASWIDSGKIISTEQKHIVPANTFELGKDYEWRVRHWDNEQEDPSDWVTATFNTYNPVIQNPTPYPDSSVRVEIRDFGAKLKSPYQRDIQLTILISDNPDFTSPTVYSLPEVASGEVATVQHAFQLAGYWYVRMVATDTESLQTVLEYQIFVSHQLFFKEPPEVTIQAPRATHVTVRVRGTTTEFTAVVTPPPPLESRIERLIMIDSGDQATCQAVAERLLEKWGRPQVSIKGTIPLTLVLRPRQKVRIVIPEVGLNEDLVLQRRQHVIEGVQAYTQITVGDIQLSESELVARIIDDLEGRSAYVSALGSEMVLLGQELSEREIADIEQGQQLSDTDITVIEMGGDDAID